MKRSPTEKLTPDELKALATAVQPRPEGLQPPASTGPANSPPGVLRDHVAQKSDLSDPARALLSQTPIHWDTNQNPDDKFFGQYNPAGQDIDLKSWGYPPEGRPMQNTLAHEFTHGWQDQRAPLQADPNQQRQLLGDVDFYAAQPGGQPFRDELDGWNNMKSTYPDNLQTNADELSARISAGMGPRYMPPEFRDKYYPGMYQPDTPYLGPQFSPPPTVRSK